MTHCRYCASPRTLTLTPGPDPDPSPVLLLLQLSEFTPDYLAKLLASLAEMQQGLGGAPVGDATNALLRASSARMHDLLLQHAKQGAGEGQQVGSGAGEWRGLRRGNSEGSRGAGGEKGFG